MSSNDTDPKQARAKAQTCNAAQDHNGSTEPSNEVEDLNVYPSPDGDARVSNDTSGPSYEALRGSQASCEEASRVEFASVLSHARCGHLPVAARTHDGSFRFVGDLVNLRWFSVGCVHLTGNVAGCRYCSDGDG